MPARIRDHLVQVTSVTDITPWYRRLTVDPRGLFDAWDPAPGAYLELTIPGRHPVQRSYTIVRPTPDTAAFEIVLHTPAGHGSAWAAQAQPGDTIAVREPPYHLVIPPTPRALFIADTSAFPAVASLVMALNPGTTATVLLEDRHPDRTLLTLPDRPNTTLTWVDEVTTADLDRATAGQYPADYFLWAAGERHLTKLIRKFARDTFVLPRANQHLQTYWIA